MNFLELCQTVRGDASLQGEGPTSVTGQTGIYAKIVRWTNEAYIEIQSLGLDFDWMRAMCELPITAGVGSYDLLSGASWNRPDVKRFLSSNSWLIDGTTRSRVKVVDHATMLRDWRSAWATCRKNALATHEIERTDTSDRPAVDAIQYFVGDLSGHDRQRTGLHSRHRRRIIDHDRHRWNRDRHCADGGRLGSSRW